MQQDQETVCRALASAALDLHRVHIKNHLGHNERFNLEVRLEVMSSNLEKFVQNELNGKEHEKLVIHVMNSGD